MIPISAVLGIWLTLILVDIGFYLAMTPAYYKLLTWFRHPIQPADALPALGSKTGEYWRQDFDGEVLLVRFWPVPGVSRPSIVPMRVCYQRCEAGWTRSCRWGPPPVFGLSLGWMLAGLLLFNSPESYSMKTLLFPLLGPVFLLGLSSLITGLRATDFIEGVGQGDQDPFAES